jgi:hypothetical protein
VLVKRTSAGIYFVFFPGISDSPSNGGRMTAAVSLNNSAGRTIGYLDSIDGVRGHVIEVDIELNGSPEDDGFTISLFGFRRI